MAAVDQRRRRQKAALPQTLYGRPKKRMFELQDVRAIFPVELQKLRTALRVFVQAFAEDHVFERADRLAIFSSVCCPADIPGALLAGG